MPKRKNVNNVASLKDNMSLMEAVKTGNKELAIQLLKENNVGHAKSLHHEALITAIEYGQPGVAIWLLSQKTCNKYFIDANNNTPLMIAIKYNRIDIIDEFIRLSNEDNNADINADNRDGDSALMFAVRSNNEEIVSLLLKATFIDINKTNRMGHCAFSLAMMLKKPNIIAMLLNTLKLDPQIFLSTFQRAVNNHDTYALMTLTQSMAVLTHAAIDIELKKTNVANKASSRDDEKIDPTASLSLDSNQLSKRQKKTHPSTPCLASNDTLSETDSSGVNRPAQAFKAPETFNHFSFLDEAKPYLKSPKVGPISHVSNDRVNDYFDLAESTIPCHVANSPFLSSSTIGLYNSYEPMFNHVGAPLPT